MCGLPTAAANFVGGLNESNLYCLFAPFITSMLVGVSHSSKFNSTSPDVIPECFELPNSIRLIAVEGGHQC
jgi:hypothetical protein